MNKKKTLFTLRHTRVFIFPDASVQTIKSYYSREAKKTPHSEPTSLDQELIKHPSLNIIAS